MKSSYELSWVAVTCVLGGIVICMWYKNIKLGRDHAKDINKPQGVFVPVTAQSIPEYHMTQHTSLDCPESEDCPAIHRRLLAHGRTGQRVGVCPQRPPPGMQEPWS